MKWNLRNNPGAHINTSNDFELKQAVMEEWMVEEGREQRDQGQRLATAADRSLHQSQPVSPSLRDLSLIGAGMEGLRKNKREGSSRTASILYYNHGHEAELQNKTSPKDPVSLCSCNLKMHWQLFKSGCSPMVWDSTWCFVSGNLENDHEWKNYVNKMYMEGVWSGGQPCYKIPLCPMRGHPKSLVHSHLSPDQHTNCERFGTDQKTSVLLSLFPVKNNNKTPEKVIFFPDIKFTGISFKGDILCPFHKMSFKSLVSPERVSAQFRNLISLFF